MVQSGPRLISEVGEVLTFFDFAYIGLSSWTREIEDRSLTRIKPEEMRILARETALRFVRDALLRRERFDPRTRA